MKRFFFKESQRNGDIILPNVEESHHIRRVLRLEDGEEVELYDGSGMTYRAVIGTTEGGNVIMTVTARRHTDEERFRLVVGQAVIKPKKMELLLQKCTELGVHEVAPIVCERSQGNLLQQYQGKMERHNRIIAEACKQCGRPNPLHFRDLLSFDEFLQAGGNTDGALRLLFWEKQRENRLLSDFSEAIRESETAYLLFGPEGGFTAAEVLRAEEMGFHPVSLGPRILRAETAVLAAVAIVQHLRGVV